MNRETSPLANRAWRCVWLIVVLCAVSGTAMILHPGPEASLGPVSLLIAGLCLLATLFFGSIWRSRGRPYDASRTTS